MTSKRTTIILSYGMGRDSTAILLRWLLEPSSRDFGLDQLVVVVSHVGNEWPDTYNLFQTVIVPLLREHKVRLVQLCRAGSELADGIVVLDDSRSPTRGQWDVPWTLRDELRRNGTIPESAAGKRKCSIKYKGQVIDCWIEREMGGADFVHVIGFNADELNRVTRDSCYGGDNRQASYPLVAWKWGHEKVAAYVKERTGIDWPKSACHFCPFSRGREEVRERILKFPDLGVDVLLLEHVAMALNENMALFADRTAVETLLGDARLEPVVRAFEARLHEGRWSVYRVRRANVDGVWDRSVEVCFTGSRGDAEDQLFDLADERCGEPETDRYGTLRVRLRNRTHDKKTLAAGTRQARERRKLRGKAAKPADERPLVAEAEEFLVLAPCGVQAKARTRFEGQWRAALKVLGQEDACPA